MNTMKTWNRWRDWAPRVLGILLIFVPLVFGVVTIGTSSLSAWILGTVVGVVAIFLALLWMGFPANRVTEWMTVMVGVVLLITPWVLGESTLSAGAWASSILGALLVVGAGKVAAENWSRQAVLLASRTARMGSMESQKSDGYGRVSNPS